MQIALRNWALFFTRLPTTSIDSVDEVGTGPHSMDSDFFPDDFIGWPSIAAWAGLGFTSVADRDAKDVHNNSTQRIAAGKKVGVSFGPAENSYWL